MPPYRRSRWTRVFLIIFFLVIVGYAFFELQGVLFGPVLDISSEITTSHDQFVLVAGKAERIVSLAMNGRDITVTEDGNFNEPYLLAPGLNRIAFDAKDKYGHTTSQTVEIEYVPAANTNLEPSIQPEMGSTTEMSPATVSTSSPQVVAKTQRKKSTTTSN